MKSWLMGLFDPAADGDGTHLRDSGSADRVELLLAHHARTGHWEELAARLDRLRRDGLHDDLPAWFRVRSAAATATSRLDQALAFLQEGRALYPSEPRIAVALAAIHASRGEREAMLELDRATHHPLISPGEAMAQVRRLALWDAHDDALSALEPVLQAAYELADELGGGGALLARGVPPGDVLLRTGAALYAARGQDDRAVALLREGAVRLPGMDVELLLDEFSVLRGGDPARLLSHDRAAADEAERRGRPTAAERLRIAIVTGRDGRSPGEAEELLHLVTLAPLDAAWIDDMRRLALEDVAHRRGDAAGAQTRRSELLANMEHVFAPDRALRFLLVDALERLAAAHRATFG